MGCVCVITSWFSLHPRPRLFIPPRQRTNLPAALAPQSAASTFHHTREIVLMSFPSTCMQLGKILHTTRNPTPVLSTQLTPMLTQCLLHKVNDISTRREVVEFRWDTQNTQTLPYWKYWKYIGWKGKERQCGNGPHTSVLMDINNLEIRSLCTKLSLGITLVVWIRESGKRE